MKYIILCLIFASSLTLKAEEIYNLDDLIEEEQTIIELNSGALFTGWFEPNPNAGKIPVKDGITLKEQNPEIANIPQDKIYTTEELFPIRTSIYKLKSGELFTGTAKKIGHMGNTEMTITMNIENGIVRHVENQNRINTQEEKSKIIQDYDKNGMLISSVEYTKEGIKSSELEPRIYRYNTEIHYDEKGRKIMEYDLPYYSSFREEFIVMRWFFPDGTTMLVKPNHETKADEIYAGWCINEKTLQEEYINSRKCLEPKDVWKLQAQMDKKNPNPDSKEKTFTITKEFSDYKTQTEYPATIGRNPQIISRVYNKADKLVQEITTNAITSKIQGWCLNEKGEKITLSEEEDLKKCPQI